jgi:hypothetical protein
MHAEAEPHCGLRLALRALKLHRHEPSWLEASDLCTESGAKATVVDSRVEMCSSAGIRQLLAAKRAREFGQAHLLDAC